MEYNFFKLQSSYDIYLALYEKESEKHVCRLRNDDKHPAKYEKRDKETGLE